MIDIFQVKGFKGNSRVRVSTLESIPFRKNIHSGHYHDIYSTLTTVMYASEDLAVMFS